MEEAKMKSKELKELKEKLTCTLKEQFNNGMQGVNTVEAGQVTDMIKDLAEAEEKCWKACYYKQIVEAMHEEKEMREKMGPEERMGYDNWRYSSGQFAPTGRGHYDPSGYTPMEDGQIPNFIDPWMENMGYSGSSGRGGNSGGRSGRSSSGRGGSSSGSSGGSQNGSNSASSGGGSESSGSGRYGYTPSMRGMKYDNYARSRMGFHETGDMKSKEEMDKDAKEYVVDMAEAIREVWKDADPNLRKEIKNRFVSLTSEMN